MVCRLWRVGRRRNSEVQYCSSVCFHLIGALIWGDTQTPTGALVRLETELHPLQCSSRGAGLLGYGAPGLSEAAPPPLRPWANTNMYPLDETHKALLQAAVMLRFSSRVCYFIKSLSLSVWPHEYKGPRTSQLPGRAPNLTVIVLVQFCYGIKVKMKQGPTSTEAPGS